MSRMFITGSTDGLGFAAARTLMAGSRGPTERPIEGACVRAGRFIFRFGGDRDR
jgi:hypothetical protein